MIINLIKINYKISNLCLEIIMIIKEIFHKIKIFNLNKQKSKILNKLTNIISFNKMRHYFIIIKVSNNQIIKLIIIKNLN